MKKFRIWFLLCLMPVLLAGCSGNGKFEPTKSSLLLKKDGSVTSADVEVLDKTYYSQEELTTFVEEQVNAYNSEHAGSNFTYKENTREDLPIAITKCELADQTATLVLDYKTADDYLAFNTGIKTPGTLFAGTIADAKVAGFEFEGSFIKVKDNSSIGTEEAIKNEKRYVAIFEGSHSISVEGTKLYMTDKVTDEGDSTVKGVDGVVSYIIFK